MKNNRRLSAFSLIEISIVILIIGILVAGVTQSSRLLTQAKLSSAKTMTQSSPITSIKNLSLWIESTSDDSFQDSDLDDGTVITAWKDLSQQATTKADFTVAGTTATPIYKTSIINGLPAVCMNNTTTCGSDSGTDDYFTTSDFSNISTASTIFAVVKLPSTLSRQVILSKRTVGSAYTTASSVNFQLSTATSTTAGWTYCDATTQATSPATCNYAASSAPAIAASTPYVVSVVYTHGAAATSNSTATGINFFQNGTASGQASTASGVAPVAVTSPLLIGKPSVSNPASDESDYFTGYIGEIVIYDRALKKEERQSIEAYLGKKWGIYMATAAY